MGRVNAVVLWGVLGLACGRTGLLGYDVPDAEFGAGNGGQSGARGGTGGSGGSTSGAGGFLLGGAGQGGAAGTINVAGGGFAGMGGGGFAGVSGAGGGSVTPDPGVGEIPPECGSFASNLGITSPAAPCAAGRAAYSVLMDGRIDDTSNGVFTRAESSLARCNFDASTWLDGSLTRDVLEAFDVLVIMPKRGMMSEEDKAVVREFIQNGGSVLVYSDYAAETTTSVENYQALLDIVGAVHGATNSGAGPTFPKFAQHPITDGISRFSVYAATTLSGEGYVPIATLGCPVLLAKDTGANRFVVSGDATPIYGNELLDHDNERLFHQTLEWLVRER